MALRGEITTDAQGNNIQDILAVSPPLVPPWKDGAALRAAPGGTLVAAEILHARGLEHESSPPNLALHRRRDPWQHPRKRQGKRQAAPRRAAGAAGAAPS